MMGWLDAPAVPPFIWTITMYVPRVVVAVVVMVSVAVADVVKLGKLRKVPTFELVPPTKENAGDAVPLSNARLTAPAHPFTPVSVIVGLALLPCTILTELALRPTL